MKVSQGIARWCRDIGTPFVAGIPGNGILEVIDRLSTETSVDFLLTRHEQGASMIACSYAFQTGRPAVVVGSKAPGATNLGIGVMGAYIESLPMVVITVQVSDRHLRYEAFEEIDLEALFKPITKWSIQVTHPDRVGGILNEAYRRAVSGRPGPVHVAIPYSLMEQETSAYVAPKVPYVPGINLDEVKRAVDILTTAERPLLIAGGGLPFGCSADVLAIGSAIGAPIVSSWLRKPVPDENELYVGMAGIGGSPAAQRAVAEADVVLALGCRFSEQMTEHYRMAFNSSAKLLHVDIAPEVIDRIYTSYVGIVADLRSFIPAVRRVVEEEVVRTFQSQHWLGELQGIQSKYRADLHRHLQEGDETPKGRTVVKTLRHLTDADTHLVLDSGNYLHWAEQYFPVRNAGLFHYPTAGTMGFGIPGAIGAKIACPDSLVCALVGDGGFAMTMAEIETARRISTPILVVIINNGTLGHIRMRQEVTFDGRTAGVDFGPGNYSYAADIFGAVGITVSKSSELTTVLTDAINGVRSGRTVVVDVTVSEELAAAAIESWWPAEQ
jgi:acetolactate synthase-1/2/3 large subunit